MLSANAKRAGKRLASPHVRHSQASQGFAYHVVEDPKAHQVVIAAGRALGLGLAGLVDLLDPQAVVVGGGLGSASGHYWDSAVAAARSAIWADVSRAVPLLQGAIGPRAAVVGAALCPQPRG